MNDETFDRLKAFVIKESAVDNEEITRDTQIEDDLGVTKQSNALAARLEKIKLFIPCPFIFLFGYFK